MRALIFGGGGQDGYYLAEELRAQGFRVDAPAFQAGGGGDVAVRESVFRVVADCSPSHIFQLAARSTTRHDALWANHEAISTGALNVLEAAWQHARSAKVFLAGSGVQFENHGSPIDEGVPFVATSPYAVSRIQSVYAARYYRTLGLRTYVGYLFHHESPRRPSKHVSRLIADAAKAASRGEAVDLEIGDTSVVKEWTFAGDVVRGILALVTQDDVFEAVIGSGEGHSIEEWLDACFGRLGLDWRQSTRTRAEFRAEYPYLVSNPKRLMSLGWTPRVTFSELAELMTS